MTALAAALRFGTLDAKGYWGDEISTVHLAHLSYGGMLHAVARLESTPPLYYTLAWLWARPFGTSEIGLRSLSALVGVATVPVLYLAARELVSRRAGLVAAGMVAINPLLVWYSQEARSYSLLVLFSAAGLYWFARALRGEGRSAAIAWSLTSALALATHYFACFMVGPQALLLLRRRRPRVVLPALIGVALASAALAPLAVHQASFGHAAWISHTSLPRRVLTLPGQLFAGFDAPVLLGIALGGVAVLGAAAALGCTRERRARGTALLGRLALAAVAAPVALALVGVDYFNARNSLGVLLPATILVAVGYSSGPRTARLGVAALAALSTAVLVVTAAQPKFHSEDWRGAAEDLGRTSQARAVVVTPGQAGRKPLEYYLGASSLRTTARVREIDVVALPHQGFAHVGDESLARILRLAMPGFRLVRRHLERDFALLSYTSPTPVAVSPRGLDRRVGRRALTVIARPTSEEVNRPPRRV